MTMIENGSHSDIILEDEETVWAPKDAIESVCATFAFEVPQQQLRRFLKRPEEHLPCLIAAAKKSRSEVTYSELSPSEKEFLPSKRN